VVSIIVIEKYILASIALHHHVIETPGDMDSGFSCHAPQLNKLNLITQKVKPDNHLAGSLIIG
jgi:hypothetical protein